MFYYSSELLLYSQHKKLIYKHMMRLTIRLEHQVDKVLFSLQISEVTQI